MSVPQRAASLSFLTALALASATPVIAADDSSRAETVIVTARPPDPVGNEAFSTVQLDASELLRYEQLDKSLEQVPGLSLFRRDTSISANPTTQGISLRAIAPSGASRALVTLDGVPQNDPFGGWVIWSALPPEDIARADIVRGAGAGPYGAGALTGVITLDEQQGGGIVAADLSAGELGTRRAAATGGIQWEKFELFASASDETSNGWIPVRPPARGAADDRLTLDASNASLRFDVHPDADTIIAARIGAYREERDSGLVGAASEASGQYASLMAAHRLNDDLQLRLQGWVRDTDFSNSSVSIGPNRSFTTPTNDQYATPALGWGINAALRGSAPWLSWEVGADLRSADGESREHFAFVSGAFTKQRVAGGRSLIGGIYAEGAHRADGWLITAGLRADGWQTDDGHLIERLLSNDAVTLEQHPPSRHGIVPTARVGARKDFSEDFFLRSAAYAGFRVPTLNELYRPFRLGNNVTIANAALKPEKLYGAEAGIGGAHGPVTWGATLFWNQLHSAITNVTIGMGPGTFPGVGFIPAGGLLIQRRNAGDINAYGIEAEAHWYINDVFSARLAGEVVHARVAGGDDAPQLTGKRPAQAAPWAVTAGIDASPFDRVTASFDVRLEGPRFADDRNTLELDSAAIVDARLAWHITDSVALYAAADNLFDAAIASTESADHVINYSTPRILRVGVSIGLAD